MLTPDANRDKFSRTDPLSSCACSSACRKAGQYCMQLFESGYREGLVTSHQGYACHICSQGCPVAPAKYKAEGSCVGGDVDLLVDMANLHADDAGQIGPGSSALSLVIKDISLVKCIETCANIYASGAVCVQDHLVCVCGISYNRSGRVCKQRGAVICFASAALAS